MATYLLTWNPGKWQWTTLQSDIDKINIQGYFADGWSCGVTKKIIPGDRVFLIRLGKEPRGIVASGWAVSKVYEDNHWNDNSKTALYIDVHFDTILNSDEKIFQVSELSKDIYTEMNWTPQASGRTIPDGVASQLETDWATFLGQPTPLPEGILPEEIVVEKIFKEGASKQITVNIYERSAEARSICIKHYGLNCSVCGFNFEKIYGKTGANFIHVHHLKPLSEIGNDYELNPLTDLRPVCPNCHTMLHKGKPVPYSIEELKMIMKRTSKDNTA